MGNNKKFHVMIYHECNYHDNQYHSYIRSSDSITTTKIVNAR